MSKNTIPEYDPKGRWTKIHNLTYGTIELHDHVYKLAERWNVGETCPIHTKIPYRPGTKKPKENLDSDI